MPRREVYQHQHKLADDCLKMLEGRVRTYDLPDFGPKVEATDLERARLAKRIAMLKYCLKQDWC